MNNNHWYLHVDLDAFFASVEQLDHPEYRGKPVIVGGLPTDKRSVVSTASYEARKFGVHSAMPTWQALKLCPNGIYVRGNHQRYAELSYKIMSIFKDFSPDVDQMSIDEAFIDLTGTEYLFGPPEQTALKIKAKVKEYTGLTVSVGLAQTKYLAKIASAMSKPDGFYFIKPGTEQEFMLSLPLEKVWGLGPKSLENLNRKGFFTTKDIFEKDYDYLEFLFGKNTATFLYNVVRGLDNNSFSKKNVKNHSISAETTFINDITDVYTIETAILELAQGVFFRLLRDKKYSKTAFVKIRYDDFSTVSIQHTYDKNICTLDTFYEILKNLFNEKYIPNRGVRLIGIGFENVVSEKKPEQQDLFETNDVKKEKVEQAILTMEQKNPKLRVQKARLLKKSENTSTKLKQLLVFLLFSISLQKIKAEPIIQKTINEQNAFIVEATGNYEASVEENINLSFSENAPFSFLPQIPVFKQNVDLSLKASLNNKFFLNFLFKEQFANNTISFLYNGDKYLQNLLVANRNVIFPTYYSAKDFGYGITGGANQAPGISLHFADYKTNKWYADFLFRYDMATQKSATFYGNNQVTDINISTQNYLKSYSFYIPENEALSQIQNIFIQNENGTYFDKDGRKYQKLNSSQYIVLLSSGQIIINTQTNTEYIPRILITFNNNNLTDNLIQNIGDYNNSETYLGKIQTYFNKSNKIYNLSNFSYNLKTEIDSKTALIIQNNFGFSPFAICNTYDVGLQKNVDLSIISKSTEQQSTIFSIEEVVPNDFTLQDDFFADNFTYAQIFYTNSSNKSYENPETRYPLAIITPETYLSIPSDSDLEILARSYSPVNSYYIGTDAIDGTVQVFINNILDTAAKYNNQNGTVELGKTVSETDKIYITWSKDSSNFVNGNIAAGAGFLYNFFENTTEKSTSKLTSDISVTTTIPILLTDTYSSYQNIHSAFVAATLGTTYNFNNNIIKKEKEIHNNFVISNKTAFSLNTSDISGLYLANPHNIDLSETFYLNSTDGYYTKNIPNIKYFTLKNQFRGKETPLVPTTDTQITGYKMPLLWNFYNFQNNSPETTNYYWQSIDIKLSELNNLANCSEIEIALQPQIQQNATNTKDISVFLQLGVQANSDYTNQVELPCWELTNLSEKKIKNHLNLQNNTWQIIKIELTDEDRAKLSSFHDARLIIVSKNNYETTGTIYFGPYQQENQNVFVYANQNLNIYTEQVADFSSNSTNSAKIQNNFSDKIEWSFKENPTSDQYIHSPEDFFITTISYFNKSDFSQYKTINFDFAYTYSKIQNDYIQNNQSKTPTIIFTLDEGADLAFNDGKIALKIELFNIDKYVSSTLNYHTLTVDIQTNEVFIDNQKLQQNEFSLQLNKTVIPNRQKVLINTVMQNKLISNGNFYINNLYYKDSTPHALIQNLVTTEYTNDNSKISINSKQAISLKTESSDLIFNNDNNVLAQTNLLGVNFSADANLTFSSDLENNKGLTAAGHSIKTAKKLFNFLTFDETYRFNNTDKSTTKQNAIKTDFSEFNIPISLSFQTKSIESIYTQQQDTDFLFNFAIPIKDNDLLFDFDSSFNQKIRNSFQLGQPELTEALTNDLGYFSSWYSTTKIAFSLGQESAYNRTEKYNVKIAVKIPFLQIEPEVGINLHQNYVVLENTTYQSKSKIHFKLPISFNDQNISFHWEKSLLDKNPTSQNGTYLLDTQKLFEQQGKTSWFYAIFPFADIFDSSISKKVDNLNGSLSLLFNSTYKISWNRKLFNTHSDFLIPSSVNFEFTKDISKISSLNDILQFKLNTENTAITRYVDYLFSLSAIYKIPNYIVQDSEFRIETFAQVQLHLENSNKLSLGLDFSYTTPNNFTLSNRISWNRPGKSSLVSAMYNLFANNNKSFSTDRKDSINIRLAYNNNKFSQNYEYLHNCDVQILKYAKVNLGCGTGITISEKTTTLNLLLQVGLKLEF